MSVMTVDKVAKGVCTMTRFCFAAMGAYRPRLLSISMLGLFPLSGAISAEVLESALSEPSNVSIIGGFLPDVAWLLLPIVLGFSVVARRRAWESDEAPSETAAEATSEGSAPAVALAPASPKVSWIADRRKKGAPGTYIPVSTNRSSLSNVKAGASMAIRR